MKPLTYHTPADFLHYYVLTTDYFFNFRYRFNRIKKVISIFDENNIRSFIAFTTPINSYDCLYSPLEKQQKHFTNVGNIEFRDFFGYDTLANKRFFGDEI